MLEAVDRPIEVLSLFRDGRIQPLRFRWNGKVFRVRRVSGEWERLEGVGAVRYFSVLVEDRDYFELAYEVFQHRWRICRVWVEG